MKINTKYENIANEHQVSSEDTEKILNGMGLTKLSQNPSKDKLEAFVRVCQLIKNGKSQEEAIALVMEEREVTETSPENSAASLTSIGEVGQEIGKQTGKKIKEVFIPKLQQHGLQEVTAGFQAGLTRELQGIAGEMDFSEIFDQFTEMDLEDLKQGKLQGTPDTVALPQGNLESSPEP